MLKIICSCCGRDLNQIWQDNMSCISGMPLCEDCFNGNDDGFYLGIDWAKRNEDEEEY